MKSPRKFAKDYLYHILGDRKGFKIRDLQDQETEEEIINELATLIQNRDNELTNNLLIKNE